LLDDEISSNNNNSSVLENNPVKKTITNNNHNSTSSFTIFDENGSSSSSNIERGKPIITNPSMGTTGSITLGTEEQRIKENQGTITTWNAPMIPPIPPSSAPIS